MAAPRSCNAADCVDKISRSGRPSPLTSNERMSMIVAVAPKTPTGSRTRGRFVKSPVPSFRRTTLRPKPSPNEPSTKSGNPSPSTSTSNDVRNVLPFGRVKSAGIRSVACINVPSPLPMRKYAFCGKGTLPTKMSGIPSPLMSPIVVECEKSGADGSVAD